MLQNNRKLEKQQDNEVRWPFFDYAQNDNRLEWQSTIIKPKLGSKMLEYNRKLEKQQDNEVRWTILYVRGTSL